MYFALRGNNSNNNRDTRFGCECQLARSTVLLVASKDIYIHVFHALLTPACVSVLYKAIISVPSADEAILSFCISNYVPAFFLPCLYLSIQPHFFFSSFLPSNLLSFIAHSVSVPLTILSNPPFPCFFLSKVLPFFLPIFRHSPFLSTKSHQYLAHSSQKTFLTFFLPHSLLSFLYTLFNFHLPYFSTSSLPPILSSFHPFSLPSSIYRTHHLTSLLSLFLSLPFSLPNVVSHSHPPL